MNISTKLALCTFLTIGYSSQTQPKTVVLIRDVSWSNYTYFNDCSFYTLMPKLYEDKISIREEIFEAGAGNWIFNQFAGLIPSSWNINIGKMTMWNYDPLDALYVGIQAGADNIVKASLDMLPISKAIIPSGKTSDIRDQGFKIKEKINVDQLIKLNTIAMDAKINRMRADRIFNLPNAILATWGLTTVDGLVSSIFDHQGTKLILPKNEAQQDNDQNIKQSKITKFFKAHCSLERLLKAGAIGLPIARWFISCHVENLYIGGYIKNFELMINKKGFVFNKQLAQTKMLKLASKVKQFGFNKKFARELQALAEKI